MSSISVNPSAQAGQAKTTMRSRPASMHSKSASNLGVGGPASSNSISPHGQSRGRDASPYAQSRGRQDDSQSFRYQDDAGMQEQSSSPGTGLRRSSSQLSHPPPLMPSKGGTLKKKASLRKSGSLKRSSSRRSGRAGSVRSLALGEKEKYSQSDDSFDSVFYTPIPTAGSPTDVLANRFQAWRKVLKDLIGYFRDLQKSYDMRSKALMATSHAIDNTAHPADFLSSGGIFEATHMLRDFHRQGMNDIQKAKEIENEVILQLTGLRSDLLKKVKEIKSLSGDFKNSVDKEMDGSRKAVRQLQEALGLVDSDPASVAGKGDPFIVKLSVDRQIERQIEEENYLHRAYLNLESSGRELESIVVGEVQKAYTAYANILRREADQAFETVERLREGPLTMAKDHEWDEFVIKNEHMVDPSIPVRSFEHIVYPGRDHAAAAEIRSGMLERKSKYLKNYTAGWYILSPTHLHEFKSTDEISSQTPVMSLYLPEQKLGSHSEPGSSSHKFMIKGRQTGGMHRGHAWVFRAESHDTMMAWYSDLQQLTEKSGRERDAFVRRSHARSVSGSSLKAQSIGSSDGGLEEDEADQQPYASEQSLRGDRSGVGAMDMSGFGSSNDGVHTGPKDSNKQSAEAGWQSPSRPLPGGRFPSDLKTNRGLLARRSISSSGNSSVVEDADVTRASNTVPAFALSTQSQQPFMEDDLRTHNDQAGQPAVPVYPTSTTQQARQSKLATPVASVDVGSASRNEQQRQADKLAEANSTRGYTHSSEPPHLRDHDGNHPHPPSDSHNDSSKNLDSASMPLTMPTTTANPAATTDQAAVVTHHDPSHPVVGSQDAATDISGRPTTTRSGTATTISDFHIPGEYPRTPKTTQ